MDEIMNPEQTCQQPQPKKWLQILLYVHLVNIVIAVLNLVPGLSKVTTWLSEGMLLAVAFVLLKLTAVNVRYRKAAILRIVTLAGTVLALVTSKLAMVSSLVSLVASICGIISTYQEYHAHAEVIEPLDQKLARKWRNLFIWSIVVGLLAGFAAAVGVVFSVIAGGNVAVELVTALVGIPSVILLIAYLVYLKRMLKLL